MLYVAVLALIKLSILFLYLRLFAPQAPPKSQLARQYREHYARFRMAVLVFAGVMVLAPSAVFFFLGVFQCRPIDTVWKRWTSTEPPASASAASSYSCLDVRTLADVAASFSIVQDVYILVAPWPLLRLLRRSLVVSRSSTSSASSVPPHSSSPPSSRASIAAAATATAMFSLVAFVLATSGVRLHFLVHFDAVSANPTWDNTDSLIWSWLEVCVSVIVTSLPTVRVLGQKAWTRWKSRGLGS